MRRVFCCFNCCGVRHRSDVDCYTTYECSPSFCPFDNYSFRMLNSLFNFRLPYYIFNLFWFIYYILLWYQKISCHVQFFTIKINFIILEKIETICTNFSIKTKYFLGPGNVYFSLKLYLFYIFILEILEAREIIWFIGHY
jgi:hypothetical protein